MKYAFTVFYTEGQQDENHTTAAIVEKKNHCNSKTILTKVFLGLSDASLGVRLPACHDSRL